MRFWTILDTYVLKRFLTTFFFAIFIFAFIACVVDYSQKVDDFVSNKAPLSGILFYFLNFSPHIIALLFPLFIFITTIFFTSKLAAKSEIIAILASGISFRRFLRPYLAGIVILGAIALISNHWLVPYANKNVNQFAKEYIWSKKMAAPINMHLRLSPELYVFIAYYNYQNNKGQHFAAETIEGTHLKKKIMAEEVSYNEETKEWSLYQVKIRTNDGLKESYQYVDSLKVPYPFSPEDLEEREEISSAMTTNELLRHAEKQEARGFENTSIYYLELQKRSSQPVAGLILTIIGVCIASRKVRGGSGFHLAVGIIISALYMLFLQFTQTLSTNTGLNPFIAMWVPNIIFAIVAYVLYRKQMK